MKAMTSTDHGLYNSSTPYLGPLTSFASWTQVSFPDYYNRAFLNVSQQWLVVHQQRLCRMLDVN